MFLLSYHIGLWLCFGIFSVLAMSYTGTGRPVAVFCDQNGEEVDTSRRGCDESSPEWECTIFSRLFACVRV